MPVPMPVHVEECIAREWTRNEAQNAYLKLYGIAAALRIAKGGDPEGPNAERWGRRADHLDIEIGALKLLLQPKPEAVSGSDFSLYVCTLFACPDDASLAETMGLPIEIIDEGNRQRAAYVSQLVESGLSYA